MIVRAVGVEFRIPPGYVKIELPFPPSTNSYWRHVLIGKRAATLISAPGRAFRGAVVARCATQFGDLRLGGRPPLDGKLGLYVRLNAPTRARRDLDNYLKALNDAMTHGGVWNDDSQVAFLACAWGPVVRGGGATVYVWKV